MKLLAALLLLSAAPAFADTSAKIHDGNWEVNGNINFTHYSIGGTRDYLTVEASAQHFLMDEFSAGLDLMYSAYGSSGWLTVAPVFTKYLWVRDNTAPYLSLMPIRFSKYSGATTTHSSTARAGVKFFLNDSVSIGPAAEFTQYWRSGRDWNSFSFLGLFSIHL